MSRLKRSFVTLPVALFILYLSYGIVVSQYEVEIIPPTLEPPDAKGFYDYRGVINIHTKHSSGSGDPEQVIAAAQEVDLDFIIITDLNDFQPQNELEGYHNKVLVFVDGEYTYLDSRLINLAATNMDHLQGLGRSQALFADLLSQRNRDPSKGMLILAHPLKPGFRWSGPIPIGMDGLEIINLKTIWQNAWLTDRASFIWTILVYPFNPDLAFIRLFDFPKSEIHLWDKLSQVRPTVAFAGTDAEAKARFLFNTYLNLPSYQTLFSLVTNHVLLNSELTGNVNSDKKKIYEALRRGQFYMSLDIMANPKGFMTLIRTKKGEVFPMGSETKWEPGMNLEIELPDKPMVPFEIVVYKDGEKLMTSNSKSTRVVLHGPGVYRAAVRVIPTFPLPDGKKWIPWIFTNAFYLR